MKLKWAEVRWDVESEMDIWSLVAQMKSSKGCWQKGKGSDPSCRGRVAQCRLIYAEPRRSMILKGEMLAEETQYYLSSQTHQVQDTQRVYLVILREFSSTKWTLASSQCLIFKKILHRIEKLELKGTLYMHMKGEPVVNRDCAIYCIGEQAVFHSTSLKFMSLSWKAHIVLDNLENWKAWFNGVPIPLQPDTVVGAQS